MDQLTDARRSELREQGLFPYSRDVTVFFVILGVSLAHFGTKFELYSEFCVEQFHLGPLLQKTILMPFGAALGALIATLFQSRFLIRFKTSRPPEPLRGLSSIVFGVIKALILGGVIVLAFRQLEETSLSSELPMLDYLFSFALGAALFVFFCFALVGFLLSRFQFTHRHSMTREEILAEAREGEMRPELRAATERMLSGPE